MSLALWVYLAGVVGNLNSLLFTLPIICGFLVAIGGVFLLIMRMEMQPLPDRAKKVAKWVFGILIFSSIIRIFIPSEQTLYLIVGAQVAQTVIDNPSTAQISDKLLKVVNGKLDEMLLHIGERK